MISNQTEMIFKHIKVNLLVGKDDCERNSVLAVPSSFKNMANNQVS